MRRDNLHIIVAIGCRPMDLMRAAALAFGLAAPLASGSALGAPLGTAVAVLPDASGTLGGISTTLIDGADLFEGQSITTGPAGQVQVLFGDQTHLVIGPRSSLVIERYLMRNDSTVEKLAVNALAGTFRFISGKSAKDAYSISTPTGTLGIRGTEFDFTVGGAGKTDVVLFKGQVVMCALSGACVTVSERCDVGSIVDRRETELLDRAPKRLEAAIAGFPYIQSQRSLRRDFRVKTPGDCLQKPEDRIKVGETISVTIVPVVDPPPPPAVDPPPPAPDPPPIVGEAEKPKTLVNAGQIPGQRGGVKAGHC